MIDGPTISKGVGMGLGVGVAGVVEGMGWRGLIVVVHGIPRRGIGCSCGDGGGAAARVL